MKTFAKALIATGILMVGSSFACAGNRGSANHEGSTIDEIVESIECLVNGPDCDKNPVIINRLQQQSGSENSSKLNSVDNDQSNPPSDGESGKNPVIINR